MSPKKFFSSAYKDVLSVEKDIFFEDVLEKNESHFFSDEVYRTVNSNAVYNYEKSLSNTYRIVFTLDMHASNVLFNITSADSYESLTEQRGYVIEEDKYVYSIEEIMTEENGWFGYLTGLPQNEGCSKRQFRPYPTDLSLVSDGGFHNYHVFLSYEHEKDDIVGFNNIPLSQGIAIYSSSTVTISNREMTKIVSPISHNLSEDSNITIFNVSGGADYTVYKLGDEENGNIANMFIIDETGILPPLPFASFKRAVDGVHSKYYITKHKKIENPVLIYRNAFANTIYSDRVFSINVQGGVDISGLGDAFGRPLTKVFLTIVKKRNTEYENFFFNSIKSGVYTIFSNSDYDISTITDVMGIPLEDNVGLDEMYGNIVEYNDIEQKDYYLEPIYHRFNSKNRSDNGYHEGYYYKPHHEIILRQFSEYIVESKEAQSPDYAYQFNSNRYIYRDLDGNELSSAWPFTNGVFYAYQKSMLFLKRQDPCFLYGSGNRNPIKGNCADFSFVKINLPEKAC